MYRVRISKRERDKERKKKTNNQDKKKKLSKTKISKLNPTYIHTHIHIRTCMHTCMYIYIVGRCHSGKRSSFNPSSISESKYTNKDIFVYIIEHI